MMKRVAMLLSTAMLLAAFAVSALAGGAEVTPNGEFPIVKDTVTVKAFAANRPAVDDFYNNEFTKWMEKKTNVHFEWESALEADRKSKINLLMASGDYPEVIFDTFWTPSELAYYASQGAVIDLTELIAKYAPETQKAIEMYPAVMESISVDGKIYGFPKVDECFHCYATSKMWIYTPWLEKLGLDMPATPDELYTVLKAFKEQDPNGNGIADEIPMAGGVWNKTWKGEPLVYLMNAFIYTNRTDQKFLLLKDGKVTPVYTQPEWQEGLKFIKKLYQEGLLVPESFTMNGEQLRNLGENPDVPILGSAFGGAPGVFTKVGVEGPDARWKQYKTVPALKGPAGNQTVEYRPLYGSVNLVITEKCKNPEVVVRWADANYLEDVMMRQVMGFPDKQWRLAEEGEVSIGGGPPKYKRLMSATSEGAKGWTWSQVGPTVRTAEHRLSYVSAGPDDLETVLYNETKKNYAPYFEVSNSFVVPPLTLTEDDARTVVDVQSQVDLYVDDMTVRFITGAADIDKDWDRYLKEFENMGIQNFLDIQQKAYEAKMAK